MTVAELQKQIRSIDKSFLNGLSNDEVNNFKNYKLFPIDLLVKAVWNYKTEDSERSAKLEEGIKRYGQIENIHVRKLPTGYYEVVNGNHRLDNMKALGKKFIIAYDHGEISEIEAKRIGTQTNELRFDADPLKLGEILNELRLSFDMEDLESTLYLDPKLLDRADIAFNFNPDEEVLEDDYQVSE